MVPVHSLRPSLQTSRSSAGSRQNRHGLQAHYDARRTASLSDTVAVHCTLVSSDFVSSCCDSCAPADNMTDNQESLRQPGSMPVILAPFLQDMGRLCWQRTEPTSSGAIPAHLLSNTCRPRHRTLRTWEPVCILHAPLPACEIERDPRSHIIIAAHTMDCSDQTVANLVPEMRVILSEKKSHTLDVVKSGACSRLTAPGISVTTSTTAAPEPNQGAHASNHCPSTSSSETPRRASTAVSPMNLATSIGCIAMPV